jgi:hypothetical protein
MNQTAQYLASKGRNGDTMLVHMSPKEVGGLQMLARNNGTSLTVNPQTGLPEAFNLGRLLPMVAGAGLTMLSGGTLSPLTIGLMTGGIGALATGSLKEGLMMGLGAAGGAGLAGSMANLAAPAAAAAAPAGSMVGAPSVMAGAGSGVTVPAAAVNTAGTTALVNPAMMPQVGLNASKAMALPSLEGTAAGLSNVGSAPVNYGFGASAAAPASVVTPGMTAVPPPGALANNLTGLDALKQSALTPMPPQPISGPMTLDPAVYGRPFDANITRYFPGDGRVLPNAYTVGEPGLQTNLPLDRTQPVLRGSLQQSMPSPAGGVSTVSSPLDAAESGRLRLNALSSQAASPVTEATSTFGGLKPQPPVIEASSLVGPSYSERVLAGGKEAFGSMQSAGDFLSNNKMNLAMSGAPLLLPEEQAQIEGRDAYIRPYSLEIDNTSGIAASPVGREDERLRYRYTAGTPYKAAKGGIIAFAEGGNTTDGQEIGTNPLSPEAARVYQSIARVQGQAGLPQIDLSAMPMGQPSPVERLNTMSQPAAPAYQAVDYQVPMPQYTDSPTYNEMQKAGGLGMLAKLMRGMPVDGYAEGGQARYRDVRKKIDRMADPYAFTGYQRGEGMYESAQKNFADGGLSNVPRFLSGGGDGMSDSIPATINNRQPARLADGEFVIPADVVSHLGNGSSKAGAKQLYAMMDRVRNKRTGKKKQAPAVNPKKMMPA